MITTVMSKSPNGPVSWRGPVLLSALLGSGAVGLLVAFLTTPVARGGTADPRAHLAETRATPGGAADEAPRRAALPARRKPVKLHLAHELEQPPVQLVPGKAGYDPTRFASFIPLQAVFVQEPRNPAWADAIERALPQVVLRDIERVLPGFKVLEVICKTSTCRLEWSAPPEVEKHALDVLRVLMPGSVAQTAAPYHYVALAGGEWKFKDVPLDDPARALETAMQARKAVLADVRAGKMPIRTPIPNEAWPEE